MEELRKIILEKGRLVVGTGNRHKFREISKILSPLRLTLIPGWEVSTDEPDENGDTYLENAMKKARHYSSISGLPALADDTGLEVRYLGGKPGVHSARYSGLKGDYLANNLKLLEELKGVTDRAARFICVAAIFAPPDLEHHFTGIVEGIILEGPEGRGGFGYDPLFFVPEKGCTYASMSEEEKNSISHRYRAIKAFRDFILGVVS